MQRLTAIAILVLAAAVGELSAVTYPERSDQHLIDAAGVIADEDEARVRARAREALSQTGVPVVVVTIESLAAQGAADWTIERYAAALYNEWGIGEAEKNLGILLLVAVKDRKLRIATGAGHGSSWEARARGIIDGEIVPRFKRGDVPGGIAAGVDAIVAELQRGSRRTGVPAETEPPAAGGEGGAWTPRGTGIGPPGGGGGGIGGLVFIGFIVMAGVAVLSVLRGVFRRGSGGGVDGSTWNPRPPMSGSGWGGWGGLVTGGLLGYLGSRLIDGMRNRGSGGRSSSSDSSWGGPGGSGFGGGSSGGGSSGGGSFGGGYTSGGGASGSW
jgi:uncharacterized protein